MLAFPGLLAMACVYLEYKLVDKAGSFRNFLAKHRPASLAFSMGLSWAIGSLFGAEGLTVMAAGVFSTVLIVPYYAMKRNGSWDRGMAAYHRMKADVVEHRDEIVYRLNQLWRFAMFFVSILVAIAKVCFAILDAIEKGASKASAISVKSAPVDKD